MKEKTDGCVLWITGLSGAGKTTLAKELKKNLPDAILLDGDELRAVLAAEQSAFDHEGRKKLALTYARFANLLAQQGFTVIVSTISLFHAVHDWNRENFPRYIEIFLDIPEAVRRARDPKGLYIAEKTGKLDNLAGHQVKVEFPVNPDIVIDAASSLEESAQKVMDIYKNGHTE